MFGANLYEFNRWTEDGYGSEIKYLFFAAVLSSCQTTSDFMGMFSTGPYPNNIGGKNLGITVNRELSRASSCPGFFSRKCRCDSRERILYRLQ